MFSAFIQSKVCNVRESNPGLPRGRREFYHWTNVAWHWRLNFIKICCFAFCPDVSLSRFCLYQQNGRSKILKQTLWFASRISKVCKTMYHKSFLKSAFKIFIMPSWLKGWKCINLSIIRWRKIRVKKPFFVKFKKWIFSLYNPQRVQMCINRTNE